MGSSVVPARDGGRKRAAVSVDRLWRATAVNVPAFRGEPAAVLLSHPQRQQVASWRMLIILTPVTLYV